MAADSSSGGDLKGVFCLCFNNDGLAAAKSGNGLVANVAGLGNDDLVAGRGNGADAGVNGFGAANGHQNFSFRVVANVVFSFDVAADLGTQIFKAAVRRIACSSALKRKNVCLADLPRCGEIGLAHTKRDNVIHSAGNVEEFTNARGLNAYNGWGE